MNQQNTESGCGLVTGMFLVATIAVLTVCYYEGYLPKLFPPAKKDDKGDKGEEKKPDAKPELTPEQIKDAPQAEVKKQIEETGSGKGLDKGEKIPAPVVENKIEKKDLLEKKQLLDFGANGKQNRRPAPRRKKFHNDWGDIHF